MKAAARRVERFLRRRLRPTPPVSPYARLSYAQEAEDLVLWRMLEPDVPAAGYYVDIGAHHPSRFSTTKIFYDRGWSGLNVDPRPGFIDLFRAERPRDTNVEAAVAGGRGEMLYHIFNEPALNGFDPGLSAERDGSAGYRLLERRPVPVVPLADLLDEYIHEGRRIDFLTVDVEGLDAEALRSNDWARYRPRFVLAEVLTPWLTDVDSSEVVGVMRDVGYDIVSRTRSTCFFREREGQ